MPPRDDSSSALAARVGAAAGRLPARELEALALREREGADYAAIAASLGVGADEVAELLVSARLAVRETVRGTAAPALESDECGEARRVLVARQDGEPVDADVAAGVREHVDGCEGCRRARRGLREASLACRAWGDVPAGPGGPAAPPSRRGRGRRRGLETLVAAVLTVAVAAAVAAAAMNGGAPTPAKPASARPEVLSTATAPPAPPPEPTPNAVSTPAATVAPGVDVVPPPGDKFCPARDPHCQ